MLWVLRHILVLSLDDLTPAPKIVLCVGVIMLVIGSFLLYKVSTDPVCWYTLGGNVCETRKGVIE